MCMRKTKIICTLGPAADSDEVVRELMLAGMNVARLNFSHGSYEEHQQRIDRVKRIREELDLPVALLLDTKGPEIITGEFEGGKTTFVEGSEVVIRVKDVIGNDKEFSVSYKELAGDVKEGSRILIDDGLIELIVNRIEAGNINPMHTPGVLVKNHGPFSWGKDPDNAVYNAVVMEQVAKMAFVSFSVNPDTKMNPLLIEKHFSRKHGPNAYYGQKKK